MRDAPVFGGTNAPADDHHEERVFALAGARVHVHVAATQPGLLDWLTEFLSPSVTVTARDADPVAVRIVVGDAPAPLPPAAHLRAFPSFVMEHTVITTLGSRHDETTITEDREWGVRWRFTPGAITVGAYRHDARLRLMVLRTVREAALAQLLPTHAQLHASGLVWRGHGIALAGPKRAGKTTVTARVAADTHAELIANDRLLLSPTETGYSVTGIPTVASVRADGLRRLPDLFRTVPDLVSPWELTRAEAADAFAKHGRASGAGGFSLSPIQMASEVGSRLVGTAQLSVIALLSFDSNMDEFAVEPISATETDATIHHHTFGSPHLRHEPTLFETAVGVRIDGAHVAPALSLDSVRCVRLTVGPQLLTRAGASARLLHALLS